MKIGSNAGCVNRQSALTHHSDNAWHAWHPAEDLEHDAGRDCEDPAHARAVVLSQSFTGQVFTTGWVLIELADGWARPLHWRSVLIQLLDDIASNADIIVVPCSELLHQEGLQLYRNRRDKEWSLTDCISFVVMQRESIAGALTGDHHFEQAGFTALLK